MKKLVQKYVELPVAVRRPLWRVWHSLIIRFDKEGEATFLNYGFEGDEADNRPQLKPEDEYNRACIQLYHHVVGKSALEGKEVLEVGCGRGGGASYISRYFNPKSYVGMDISTNVVAFCNDLYKNVTNLRFVYGVAETLPFGDASFDYVVNVESARCYASIEQFFRNVHRVLRPGGTFLFTDMVRKEHVSELVEQLEICGFRIEENRNISENIVKSLNIDTDRRMKLIQKYTPGILRSAFQEFAGTKGSGRYNSFASGEIQYHSFLLTKA